MRLIGSLIKGEQIEYRTLKIAASAISVTVCMLLIALWVRSHWVCDGVIWNGGHRVAVFSCHGQIRVSKSDITFSSEPLLKWQTPEMPPDGIGSWFFQAVRRSMFVVFPHRLPIIGLILFAAVPWIHWRYSLRSVLIAVTVVSLLLGLLFAF